MSRHMYRTKAPAGNPIVPEGAIITIVIGWDRPLQGYFMDIEDAEYNDVYGSLNDSNLHTTMGFASDLAYFERKLEEMKFVVPQEMIDAVRQDGIDDAGNVIKCWNDESELNQPENRH